MPGFPASSYSSRLQLCSCTDTTTDEPRDHLLSHDFDRPHDLVVCGTTDLEHEDHLIDAGRCPALHLTTHAVRIATNRHAAVQQIIVRIAGHARLDARDAFRRAEPHVVQCRVVVAIVEPRRGTADLPADPVIVVHAADGEHADMVVDEPSDRRRGADCGAVCVD